MKTKTLTTILFVLFISNVKAQTDVDASRYSGSSITGTSRFTAMSGAFGALGGDFTTLSYNPAGIAIYRSSEFSFTPSVFIGSTTSNFQGNTFKDSKSNFNFGNIGIVFTKKLSQNENSEGWKSWNFGFGYNRLDNFHNRSFYQGQNQSNSMLDNFAENASGLDPNNLDPFYENLAYNTYLINPDSNNQYTSVIPFGGEIQKKYTETRGAIGETVISFGGNYSNRLYIGATFGFKSLSYDEISTYEEFDPDTLIPEFNQFLLHQDLTTHGWGFNFKAGAIYKANDVIRFGLAIETPTWYGMHDWYYNSMSSDFDTDSGKFRPTYTSPDGYYEYSLTTPFKAMGSVAFVFGSHGLLSADYEFKDNSEANYHAYDASFSEVNNLIRRKYSDTHTIRIGGELVLGNISLRGGTSFTSSPLNQEYQVGSFDFSKKSFSGGIGFRDKNMYLDLAYAYTTSDQYLQPYPNLETELVPGVKSTVIQSNITLTLGAKF